MPTIIDLVDVGMPTQINGVAQVPIEGSSFAATLEHSEGVGTKHVQYFEMLGNRGIWQNGWKAVLEIGDDVAACDSQWIAD